MRTKISKIASVLACICFAFAITGCAEFHPYTNSTPSESVEESVDQANSQGSYVAHEWNATVAPNGYEVQGNAVVEHEFAEGEYVYEGLDALGRTMPAYACITTDDYAREKVEDREDFKSDADKISGWGYNEKVSIVFPNGKVYNGYFYNRSHLIADSLGGTPMRENLITGTRFQNVGYDNKGGMAYTENTARDWLGNAPAGSYIYYAVTPVYVDNELVPRSVYVDMLSSDGSINEHVEVFNVSGDPAYEVDYHTGQIIEK